MTDKRTRNLETDRYVLFYTNEFSQWYTCAFVSAAGQRFTSAEQYMMHEKARLFGDTETAKAILATEDPERQKALGRQVKNFNKAVWEARARDIVFTANRLKFTQDARLWRKLKQTAGKRLVEASAKDTVWGIGLAADDPRALEEKTWRGTNWLGDALTKLRDTLLAEGFDLPTPAPRPPKPR
jgi:ribA/ribD-fused uncharacterized protein